jgi:hypothetical protein
MTTQLIGKTEKFQSISSHHSICNAHRKTPLPSRKSAAYISINAQHNSINYCFCMHRFGTGSRPPGRPAGNQARRRRKTY